MATQTGSQAVERASALLSLIVESGAAAHLQLARRRARVGEVHDVPAAAGAGAQPAGAPRPGGRLPPRRAVLRCTPPGRARCTTCPSWPARRWSTSRELSRETVNLAVPRGGALVRSTRSTAATWSARRTGSASTCPRTARRWARCSTPSARSRCRSGNLERRTAHSPVDRAQFDHALVEVRRRGWAASLDELELGLTAVGAPVRTVDGTVVAAVSVSGPTNRINEYGITQLGDLLVAELRGLSALLGHQPRPEGRLGMKEGSA